MEGIASLVDQGLEVAPSWMQTHLDEIDVPEIDREDPGDSDAAYPLGFV